jgi:hypothetical protein
MKDRLLSKRRPLITFPLEWQMTAEPVPHPVIPILAERGGTQLQGRYRLETPRYPDWKTCASWSGRISRTWSIGFA